MYYNITQVMYNGIYQNVHDTVYDTTFVFIEDEQNDTNEACTGFINRAGLLSSYQLNTYPLS